MEIPDKEKLDKPDQHEILECALATSRGENDAAWLELNKFQKRLFRNKLPICSLLNLNNHVIEPKKSESRPKTRSNCWQVSTVILPRIFFLTCMRGTRGNLISLHFNPFSLIIHVYMDVLGTEIHFTVIVKRPL